MLADFQIIYWGSNNTIADAILDRIVYSSHRIELEGESMRKINSLSKNIE